MTPARLAELRALHRTGTRPPWKHTGRNIDDLGIDRVATTQHVNPDVARADAALIAAARNALPDLLDALAEARAKAHTIVEYHPDLSGQGFRIPATVASTLKWADDATVQEIMAAAILEHGQRRHEDASVKADRDAGRDHVR